jgi:superfamily II DNA/RNA helicase
LTLLSILAHVTQVQCIIFAPSRELVQQISGVARDLFEGTPWRVHALIGGANVQGQVQRLRDERPQIVVATPGRLGEIVFHLEKLRLGGVRTVVVDEVDNMLQEPYLGDLEAVIQATPLYSQHREPRKEHGDDGTGTRLWMASATSNSSAVSSFADKYAGTRGWRTLSVEGDSAVPSCITHGVISSPKDRALGMLKRFLHAKPAIKSAIIFVNDPKRVGGVCRELEVAGIIAAPLHGETSKDDRKVRHDYTSGCGGSH